MSAEKTKYFGYDQEAMSNASNYYQWIMDSFRPHIGRVVAEIGGGMGHFSDALLDLGVEHLDVFEPSENMFHELEQRFKDDVRVQTYNLQLNELERSDIKAYDSICYVNVLEHIERDLEELQYARQNIKQGGYLLIFVPALDWLYSNLDYKLGHYRRYSKTMLIDVVKSAGFVVESVKFFDFIGVIPWYVLMVLMKRDFSPGNVFFYDKLVVPVMRVLERVVEPRIGKNLILIARNVESI